MPLNSHDGFRIIAHKTGAQVRLYSRSGKTVEALSTKTGDEARTEGIGDAREDGADSAETHLSCEQNSYFSCY